MGSAVECWVKITDWLRECAPGTHAQLSPPATPEMVRETEQRIGSVIHPDLRSILLVNNGCDKPGMDRTTLINPNYCDVTNKGLGILGLTHIEAVHEHMMWIHRNAVEEGVADEDAPLWKPSYISVTSEWDGFYGTFVDSKTGEVGSWAEGETTKLHQGTSLADFLTDAFERLRHAHLADEGFPRVNNGFLIWNKY
ncbi:SMI1/KNR4 family protein [Streptomyces sp. NPDC005727]|uniref:SMI1/KNR4 family protein n=1 Tax=Streptomyces sp. NPDC005727 TaxID=3157053 RepID=UPI0033FA2E46